MAWTDERRKVKITAMKILFIETMCDGEKEM